MKHQWIHCPKCGKRSLFRGPRQGRTPFGDQPPPLSDAAPGEEKLLEIFGRIPEHLREKALRLAWAFACREVAREAGRCLPLEADDRETLRRELRGILDEV